MGEILSHAEIEAILSATPASRPRPHLTLRSEESKDRSPPWNQPDFMRPDPLRGSELTIIRHLQTNFGRRSKSRIAAMIQADVEIRHTEACQTTLIEYMASLTEARFVCTFGHDDTAINAFLVLNASFMHSLFMRLLGGQDTPSGDTRQSVITNIERRLLTKLIEPFREELSEQLGAELKMSDVIETSSKMLEIETGLSIWLSFEILCGDEQGIIQVGLPRRQFHPESQTIPMSVSGVTRQEFSRNSPPCGIEAITVEVSAILAGIRMRASDLAALQIGDVLITDRIPNESVILRLDSQSLCAAIVGTHGGRRALRLIEPPNVHDNRGCDSMAAGTIFPPRED